MTDANKPANTPSPRVIKQHPSGKDNAVERSLSDSEQVAATGNEDPPVPPGDSLVPLESVLCTEELNRRPSRPPDYKKESHALTALAQALADSPRTILQQLAETILEVFQSDSAGISLLTTDDGGKRFHWPAIAGVWKPHIGGGTPRDFGPCGDVLDRNTPLLFRHFERRYAYFLPVTPPIEECLLVPFYVGGKAVGTIWAIAHNDRRKFDAEDMRQLLCLGKFASSAYQAVAVLDGLEQRVAALQKANVELQASRRVSLSLMDDAIRARQVTDNVIAELRQAEGSRSILTTDMREANAHLVVTAVHAHTRTEDAEQANHLKDEFLATMSHELRTPLNAVLGWARMLGSQQLPPDRAGHAIAIIERNAVALTHLIDDLLDISRIGAGTLHLSSQPVDLVAVVQAALDAVRPLAATGNVHLAFSHDLAAINPVSGDAGRLQQVIWNLLANAIKFTPEDGRVGSSSNPRTTTWRSGSSIQARASVRTFCHTCSSASARPMARRRDVTPGSVSGWPSFGSSLSCTGEPCRRPVKAWGAARRSPSVCRFQPARLEWVKRPCSSIDGPRRRRPRPCRAYRGSTGSASWSSMTTSTGAR